MRVLKHIAGILLATVGTFFLLGAFELMLNPDPDISRDLVGLFVLVGGLLPLGGAFLLLRRSFAAPCKPCPQCGSTNRATAGVLRRSQSFWFLHFGGWLLSSLWGASRGQQFRCAECDTLYITDTRSSRIAGILLWVFILIVLMGVAAQQLERK